MNNSSGSAWLVLSGFGIHLGGGMVLQRALLEAAGSALAGMVVDTRFEMPASVNDMAWVERVPRSILARLAALQSLGPRVRQGQLLFCFNGLPPLKRSKGTTIAYIQSAHFAGLDREVRYSFARRLRHLGERLLFRLGRRNLDAVWVQTPSVQEAMRRVAGSVPVEVQPFTALGLAVPALPPRATRAIGQFLYPADGTRHKNHATLLKAWSILGEEAPQLALTLNDKEMTDILRQSGLASLPPTVRNLGRVAHAEILAMFGDGAALVFPSLTESFGLPLLEAALAGAPIVASELDYVRDVVEPQETFDPRSPLSIARAVRRVCRRAEPPISVVDAAALVGKLAERA